MTKNEKQYDLLKTLNYYSDVAYRLRNKQQFEALYYGSTKNKNTHTPRERILFAVIERLRGANELAYEYIAAQKTLKQKIVHFFYFGFNKGLARPKPFKVFKFWKLSCYLEGRGSEYCACNRCKLNTYFTHTLDTHDTLEGIINQYLSKEETNN